MVALGGVPFFRKWRSWEEFEPAIHNRRVVGGLNASAPNPVRYTEYAHALGDTVGRRVPLRLPRAVMRWALGDVADAVLHNRRMVPDKALQLGHRFQDPELGHALKDLLGTD